MLGGEITRARDLITAADHAGGKKPPRITLPTWMIRLTSPLGGTGLGTKFDLPSNVGEMITATDGVTYWATDEKARTDLGYSPRSLATGMAETFRDGT